MDGGLASLPGLNIDFTQVRNLSQGRPSSKVKGHHYNNACEAPPLPLLTIAAVLFCIRSYTGSSTWRSTGLYQPQVLVFSESTMTVTIRALISDFSLSWVFIAVSDHNWLKKPNV